MGWWPFGTGSSRQGAQRHGERAQPALEPRAGSSQNEEARIRAAYAMRQQDDARYSYFSMGNLFEKQERERRLLTLLKRYGLTPLQTKKILDVGCGTGAPIREFVKWGAQLEHMTGIDLLLDHLVTAKHVCPEGVSIVCGNAAALPFPDATFD